MADRLLQCVMLNQLFQTFIQCSISFITVLTNKTYKQYRDKKQSRVLCPT